MSTQKKVKYIHFQTLDGSQKWDSKRAFLCYLYKQKQYISDHILINKYMRGKQNGTFTIDSIHYVFTAIYHTDEAPIQKPIIRNTEETKPLVPATYTTRYRLSTGIMLELTKATKSHNLLHTKSIAL